MKSSIDTGQNGLKMLLWFDDYLMLLTKDSDIKVLTITQRMSLLIINY